MSSIFIQVFDVSFDQLLCCVLRTISTFRRGFIRIENDEIIQYYQNDQREEIRSYIYKDLEPFIRPSFTHNFIWIKANSFNIFIRLPVIHNRAMVDKAHQEQSSLNGTIFTFKQMDKAVRRWFLTGTPFEISSAQMTGWIDILQLSWNDMPFGAIFT